jgi:cyanophycinase
MKHKGRLIIIGGAEDKEGRCEILKEVAASSHGQNGKLLLITTAAQQPEEVGRVYTDIFKKLGVADVQAININERQDALEERFLDKTKGATCVFFTGGDQLRITSILGGTAMGAVLKELFDSGVVIVGTSAGASAMSSTMIVTGSDDDSPRKCTLKMAPGLGLLESCVIDQHFAQRGRIGRLMCAVAQNPHVLGIGIDEDTAIVVEGARFRVIGSYSNVSESKPDDPLALMDVTVHVLPKGFGFDLVGRKPIHNTIREDTNEDN